MSLMLCAAGCGAPAPDDGGFCGPCRESLGLAPVPEPVKRHWSEAEREGFRERERRARELQARIADLPDQAFNDHDDPFLNRFGGPLNGLANGGGKR